VNTFASTMFGTGAVSKMTWLGGTDDTGTDNVYRWTDGTAYSYDNFDSGNQVKQ
jgi:hypothetical protein